jgi:uncharacterized protein (TIGR03437 family)
MDAAQTNIKKITFFLALALLLSAPSHALAQPTLNVSNTTLAIGSSSCNDFQSLTVNSSDGSNQVFSVTIQYTTGNTLGSWLYVRDANGDSTSGSTPFNTTTTTAGTTLTIGLNQEIASATPQATVVLTPADGSAAVSVTIFYTQNTSCGGNTGSAGNGFFNVTPGSVSITAGTSSEASQSVTIQDLIGTGTTFGFSVSPSGTWLSATANSTTITGGGTASVNVTANANQTAGVGTYVGTLTITPGSGFGSPINIPVTFVVTNGSTGTGPSSGTLTVGNTNSSTDTVSFNYVFPSLPSDQCVPLQDTASGADYYTVSVNTANGVSWLLANGQTSTTVTGSLAPGAGACIDLRLSNAASSLVSGAYQGTVSLTSSSGATATITVDLYISAGQAPGITGISPGLIYVFGNVAPNSSVQQEEVFQVTAANGYTMGTASLSTEIGGFSMNTPVFSNNTQSFTITSSSTGLTTGVYATTVTITSNSGTSTNTTTITIVLPVGQSGATTTTGTGTNSAVSPVSLAFQQQQGSSFWTSGREAQDVTITGQSGTTWSASVVYASGSGNWLNFDSPSNGAGTFGNGPATLAVDLFNGITSLTPSSTPYQATVSISTPGGTTIPVAVSLLVTPSNTPVLLGLPALTTFAATTGSNPTPQTVQIVGSDNTSSTTTPPITAGTPTASWVTVSSTNGNSMTLSASPSGLSTGIYSAIVPVSASAYNNPLEYPVVMIVNGGGTGTGTTGGPLTLNPTSISFNGVTSQSSQNLSVTANTTTSFTVVSSESSCNSTAWLTISPSGAQSTASAPFIAVTANPAGIGTGTTCTGTITLSTSSAAAQTVTVTMTVGTGTATGSGNVTVNPTSMTFAYTQNQALPAAQTATIVNAQSGTASISFTVATQETVGTSVNWLQTNLASGTASTPYNSPGLSVSVAPGSLSPGTYNGTVVITPNGGTAVSIAVTLTVTGNAVVTASPTTLTVNYTVGGTSPTATIQVSGGGAAAGFTATAASTLGWLAVSPTTGTTPNTGTLNLTVSIVPTVLSSLLPPGSPYAGTITVTGTSPASGTTIVNVTLNVTAPLPAITGVTNAASFATGPISPGEIISIFASDLTHPIGPANPVTLNSTTCPGTCTQVPTSMGGVQVRFLPGNAMAPLLFVDAGQINAVVPYAVAGIANLSVEVLYLGQTSNAFPVSVVPTAPGIFTQNASGTGPAAVLQYDTTGTYQGENSASKPASKGWYLAIYLTGEGSINVPNIDAYTGTVTSSNPPFPQPILQPNVTIGNAPATIPAGGYIEAPGFVSGLLQINAIVPANAGTGAVTMFVSIGTASSQAGVTVYLQ